MNRTDVFSRRSEPRWMNEEPPPYGYGGNAPRTEIRCIMCCNKCEEKVREELDEVDGVQDVFTDQARSEVVVYGPADTHDVLKKARKVDKRADITSSNSFTLHQSKLSLSNMLGLGHKLGLGHRHQKYDKHNKYNMRNRNQVSDYGHGHGHGHGNRYNGRGNFAPIEAVGSPRYNSSYNQSRPGESSRFNVPDYRQGYNQSYNQYRSGEKEYRHIHDGYRSEPEFRRHQHNDRYRPHSEFRSAYEEYRPEHDHRYRSNGYRPSQNYPPTGYYDDRDYIQDFPYPEMVNPDYLKPVDSYYY